MRLVTRKRPTVNSGFTLVEILVATTISVGMLTLVMASFWTLWEIYRTSDLMREMQHEGTFAMARMADKIRANGLDYPAYVLGGNCRNLIQDHNLCIGDGHFFTYDNDLAVQNLFMGDTSDQDPLFSEQKFAVTAVDFTHHPLEAPVRTNTNTQFQPQVSIYLQLQNRWDIWGRPVDPADALKLDLHTTISSREYDF